VARGRQLNGLRTDPKEATMIGTGGWRVIPGLFLLLLPVFAWAEAPGGTEPEKAAVERTIRASIGWALQKDKQLLYDSVARDADLFIFHPDSRSTVVGFEPFRKLVEGVFMSPKFKATDFQVKDLRIRLSKAGDAAWFSALLDDHGEWDGRPTGRDTMVLVRRAGRWQILADHFSAFPPAT
jgi:hypothetical protein